METGLAAVHGGGGQQWAYAPATGHADQGAAIGGTFRFAKGADGGLVTGQLAVLTGQLSRPPHQRIPPVQRQTHRPQQRPHMVAMAEMGGLVGHRVAQQRGVIRRGLRHIDGGPEQAEQTGHRPLLRHIDGKCRTLHRQRTAAAPQTPCKADVGRQKHQQRRRRAAPPHRQQELAQGQGALHTAELVVCDAGRHRHRRVRHQRPGGIALHRTVMRLPDGIHLPDAFHRLYRWGLFHHRHDADIRAAEADGEQQPRQHQQPQGVLQPQADPSPQQIPQGDHRKDQDTRGYHPFNHALPPFPAKWRTACRSPPETASASLPAS